MRADPSRDDSPSGGRTAWIDGVRALGALLVLLFHATQNIPAVTWISSNVIGFGRLGVLLLVIQGGYLIPRLMESLGSPVRFWVGRAIRFYPAYWTALAIFLIILAATGDRVPDARTIALNALYFPEPFGAPYIMGNIWTMALILACYGAVSVAMVLFHRTTMLRAAIWGSMLLLAICLVMVLMGRFPLNRAALICVFLAGAVLREARERGLSSSQLALALLATISPALITLPTVLMNESQRAGFAYVFIPLIAAIGIQMLVAKQNPAIPKSVAAFGKMSYSIYLAQAPALLLLQNDPETAGTVVLRLATSLAAGYAIFRLVETPTTRLGRKWSKSGKRTAMSER